MNPSLVIIDDEKTIRASLSYFFRNKGYDVYTAGSGSEGVSLALDVQPDVVLIDFKLPDIDGLEAMSRIRAELPQALFVMLTGHGSISGAVEAVRSGAFDYLAKPVDMDELELTLERALDVHRLKEENLLLRKLHFGQENHRIIGNSPAIHKLNLMVSLLAENSDTTVLIEGESGTGKELFARAIHDMSDRKQKPFVEVNCASLSEHLLESELFGHEKGSFTDAKVLKKGLVEVADGGTLLLDEVGELSQMLQPKLLRMLETRTFRRVGGTRDIRFNVRFIAATNRNLAELVGRNLFREDLYYRLKVMPIEVPPLRERPEDILPIAKYFIATSDVKAAKKVSGFTPDCEKFLVSYNWPGNARELRNVVERALILCSGEFIESQHLPKELTQVAPAGTRTAKVPETLEQAEKRHIAAVLKHTSGNQSAAAKLLGISRSTLIAKSRKYRLV